MMKRSFDLVLALIAATTLLVPALLVAFAIKLTSAGPIL
jgi:O-antigen biosynthesis protein WbqP